MYNENLMFILDPSNQPDSFLPTLTYNNVGASNFTINMQPTPGYGVINSEIYIKEAFAFYCTFPVIPSLNSLTLELIVRCSSIVGQVSRIIGLWRSQGVDNISLGINNLGNIDITDSLGASDTGIILNDGQYHHLVLSIDSSKNAKLYKDGKLVYTKVVDVTFPLQDTFYIGSYNFIDCYIKGIRIYSTNLSQVNVIENYYENKSMNKSILYVKENNIWYKTEQRRY